MTPAQLSVAFFLQMAVILAFCKAVGALARRVGQPQVVGEMIAGVVLGPSLIGHWFPEAQKAIFPPESLNILYAGAQFGVGLYMFLVGVEFRTDLLVSRIRSAASVSLAGMGVPFLLALPLAVWLSPMRGLFSEKVTLFEAWLFLGATISITAFPMLARIIYERGLTGTSLGTLALAAGAIDDAAAWCVLAVVLASFGAGAGVAIKAIGGAILYAGLVLTVGRMLFARFAERVKRQGGFTEQTLAWVLLLFSLGAWTTDAIGIHAVFGGFLLGAAMPRGWFAEEVKRRLESMAVVFFLPMFFTYSGLKTRLDMVNNLPYLMIALVLLVASIVGKGVACWAAARLHGEDNRTALAVGSLMNARGLMELIILNIGLQHGVIQPALFSMMVLMAIVTTLMASPLFEWVYGRHERKSGNLAELSGVE